MYGDWGLDLIVEEEEEDPTTVMELSPEEMNQWSSGGQSILQQAALPGNKSDSGLYFEGSSSYAGSRPTEGDLSSEWTVASLLEAGGLDTQVSRWSHLARARLRDVVSRAVMRPLSPPTQGGQTGSSGARLHGPASDLQESSSSSHVSTHQVLLEETASWVMGLKLQEIWEDGWAAALPRWNETFHHNDDDPFAHGSSHGSRRMQGGGGGGPGNNPEQTSYKFFKWSDLSKLRPK